MSNNIKEVNKMILDEAVATKSNKVNKCQKRDRALSLLLEDMAVWFPYPYYDAEAIVFEETKRSKAQPSSKIYSSDLPAKQNTNKKPLKKLKIVEVVVSA
jgi:hypothetical protein